MSNRDLSSDLSDSLGEAERRLQAAQLASNVRELTDLIDDAAWFTGPDGNIYTKQDDLDAHRTGYQVLSRVHEEELRILATSDLGVTWFLGVLEGVVGGQPMVARMRYTRTWIRGESGDWKIIAAHAMLLADGGDTDAKAEPGNA